MKELSKIYDPKQVEDRTYQFWLDGGYFHAEPNPDKKPYTAAEHHRSAAHGTRAGRNLTGYPDSFPQNAGL